MVRTADDDRFGPKRKPGKTPGQTDFKAWLPGLLAIPVVNVLLDLILGEPITLLDRSF